MSVLTEDKNISQAEENWDTIIEPRSSTLSLNLKELWRYRDLLLMFVKRDIITIYKQTVLGPVWYIVQPIMTTAVYILVFGNIAKISTDGLPQVLFYLSGIIIWSYFANTFNTTSQTFKSGKDIFGKVYFPRLIMPLSKVTSGLIRFGIQFVFFVSVYTYFILNDFDISPNYALAYFPLFILTMAGLGLGFGLIFSAMTAKYRDLTFLIQFGVQLLMYATPVIYPVSTIPEKYKLYILANPMTPIVEGFRYALLGAGSFDIYHLLYSLAVTGIILLLGIFIFNKTERTFMDTV